MFAVDLDETHKASDLEDAARRLHRALPSNVAARFANPEQPRSWRALVREAQTVVPIEDRDCHLLQRAQICNEDKCSRLLKAHFNDTLVPELEREFSGDDRTRVTKALRALTSVLASRVFETSHAPINDWIVRFGAE